ncbi:heme synthase [Candidatus Halobonum tyrrellensis G22]|uniref:Protoheme IX farnesyltransferase n=1 Tax=Candidatus Halobonum tyrrellensis G22 TaxID=1324957 RepID=V4HKN0_9EURY|nr:heme o synthase [Candidatus Halobonum tyrrellensis]ESP88484.1 heme synthase [Candidatus Halobonum tyrrellensis G22]
MHSNRFPALLAATAMGVYLLLVVGATTAVTDAAAACAAWPACGGGFALPSSPAGWVALGHRTVALVVGLLVVATAVAAVRQRPPTRVWTALALAVLLYPVQSVLGAYVAVAGAGATVTVAGVALTASALHLVGGLCLFAGLVAALGWELEAETGDPDESPSAAPLSETESAPEPTAVDAGASPSVPAWRDAPLARARLTATAYFRLTKPRLMWLLCLVASAAMALAGANAAGAGSELTPEVVAATLAGGALAIGASGTFNHVLERDVDRRMQRTSDRPLAVDLVSVRNAVAFGLSLTVASLALFAWVNLLSAVLGLVAILFYSVVYTLVLKPNTVQNTVVGGAAGALPALIGWAAVTGTVGLGGVALATLIFLWTPAHFYNLALAYKDDYERGGFPMMPVVRGETVTRRHIVWYFGATLAVGAAMVGLGALDWLYALAGAGVGAVFLWTIVRLHYERDEPAAFRAFHASNAYLGAVLLAVVVDALVV